MPEYTWKGKGEEESDENSGRSKDGERLGKAPRRRSPGLAGPAGDF